MTDSNRSMTTSREVPASSYNGYLMLVIWLALFAWTVWAFLSFGRAAAFDRSVGPWVAGWIFGLILFLLTWRGFYMIQPNQGVVITLFGEYRGTDRKAGLQWTWPWMGRRKIGVRAHNVHSEKVKINDLRGNPVEIACNVVWRVRDTAQASFDVDDYKTFVNIQIEAGLRTVGARHPYDDMNDDDKTTLRGSADVVSQELQTELNERLSVAGIVVDEAGLTYLAYAPEIAGAMLRRQQAEAIIAARKMIVLGAVSMVEDALGKLSEGGIVELDDERRASMVSNLMVVLCGDRDAQPVVNAGTLYQ